MCCGPVKRRLWAWLLLALTLVPAVGALGASFGEDEKLFKPLTAYQTKGRRDPFVQPQAGMTRNVMNRVDIGMLHLTGVIHHPQRSLALFSVASGPKFGYLLKGGKLYRENNQPVAGITGEILSTSEVALKQGDDRMVFKLR
jgi:Tfp pilus assembly protein PilP